MADRRTPDDIADDFFTPDELRAWFPYLVASTAFRAQLDSESKRASNLSLLDFNLLMYLAVKEGNRARMSDMALANGMDPSTITYRISRLEKQNWVVREKADEDRRGVFARITDDGLEKLHLARPAHVAAVRRTFLNRFTADQLEQIGDLFSVLAKSQGLPSVPQDRLIEDARRQV